MLLLNILVFFSDHPWERATLGSVFLLHPSRFPVFHLLDMNPFLATLYLLINIRGFNNSLTKCLRSLFYLSFPAGSHFSQCNDPSHSPSSLSCLSLLPLLSDLNPVFFFVPPGAVWCWLLPWPRGGGFPPVWPLGRGRQLVVAPGSSALASAQVRSTRRII